ncbi:hypothetical protein PG994_008353 [Apiospora phragmitis]|uniref:Uncharacterized protein n=1 Tax=Apiospora phragmitis TaxID=2905665 RepID=A0ABR1UTG6_9PEZI
MSETAPTSGPPQVIHAALFKMATRSMAEAYKILGLHTHHGMDDIWGNPWEQLEKATEVTWPAFAGPNAGSAAAAAAPSTPTSSTARLTREQWDEVGGGAITDLASPFTEELVQAYPDAKVVVRPRRGAGPDLRPVLSLDMLMTTIPPVTSTRKQMLGFFGARSVGEIDEQRARDAYERHFRRVRELVPAERRLEYVMGSGWEPLCAFLGKEVPDVPFPWVNEGEEFASPTKRSIA